MQDQTLETQLDVPLATYPCGESLNKPYIYSGYLRVIIPKNPYTGVSDSYPKLGWITFMMTCRQRAQRKTCGGTHNAKPSDFHMHTHTHTRTDMTDMAQGKSHCDTNGNSNNSKGQVILPQFRPKH